MGAALLPHLGRQRWWNPKRGLRRRPQGTRVSQSNGPNANLIDRFSVKIRFDRWTAIRDRFRSNRPGSREFGFKRLRFASADELKDVTGLVPGSVPTFGRPILPFDLYLDETLRDNDRIALNAGSLTDSIILSMPDCLRIAAPRDCFAFSLAP
jgi:hypothetical protein